MSKEKKTEQWVTVAEFVEHYNLSKTLAYTLIHAVGFPSMKVSKRAYRVDLSRTDEYFKKYYN